MTIEQINTRAHTISAQEGREYIPATDFHLRGDYLELRGGNVGEFERVRRILARDLGVSDVYSFPVSRFDDDTH